MQIKRFFEPRENPKEIDLALLLLRVVCGVAFAFHGSTKIQHPFSWAGPDSTIPGFFLGLAALSEFGGGIGWALGLLTRLSSFGIACTMLVAVGMHVFVLGDPFVSMTDGRSYELALIFLSVALLLLAAGPGRYSFDRKLFGRG